MAFGLRYPLQDLDFAMDAVLARVRADTGSVSPDLSLAVDPTFGDPDDDAPTNHVVVRIEKNTTLVGFRTGLEAGCAETMSVVQDAVVDSLGRPWPEVDNDGGGIGVLDVALEPAGIAHWALRGEPVCPVGQLAATCCALGWRIR